MSMEPADYQKYLVLFVDDEDKTRKYFKRLFGDTFRILLASDGVEALEVLQQHVDEIGLIVTDQRMPNETGVAFLEKAVLLKPSLVRILSTAYADIEAAIDSVNKGGVYRYVTKPWDVADFEVTLRRAMEFYLLQSERDDLLKQKLAGLESLAVGDRILSLAALAAVRESGLRHINEGLSALVQLHGICSARAGHSNASISGQRLTWSELYRRHHTFLNKAMALLPKGLAASAALLPGKTVPAASVLVKAGSGRSFNVVTSTGQGTSWPGPEILVTEVVTALLDGVKAILSTTDEVQITDKATGVE
ncbi:MAG: Response regulator receiver protein, partial [Verrucomicrobiaceae bacterium]|nr:Response regulator receiver protein [Verrucomicrobiaceae bacterium]